MIGRFNWRRDMARVFGPQELVKDVQERGLCVGCGACVDLCPYFKNYKGKTAMVFPCNLEKGRCYAFCPKAEVDLDELAETYWEGPYEGAPLGKYREVMIARGGAKARKGLFQAGGTVSALVAFALSKKTIDAAVLTGREGLVAVPGIATKPREVVQYASSKYMAAPTLSAFNRAVHEGQSRLGIVGTPCQMTAVAQMRMNPTGRGDFKDVVALAIGLFCTWALDTRGLMAFLSKEMDIRRIRKMDIPPPPAEIFVIETDDGRVEMPLGRVRPFIPEGCHLCPDMTAEWADLSVGVLEGRPDWNTLIVRTARGSDLVRKAVKAGHLITEAVPKESLEHLSFASGNKRRRAFSRAKERGLLNTDEDQGRSALRVRPQVVERLIREGGA
jgi:coenzyme F420 hydrogenase subunit beta